MIKKIAVIVAAGSGIRMGSSTPKQFLLLRDKPVLWHSIAAFQNTFEDMEIRLVISREYFSKAEGIRLTAPIPDKISLIAGGKTRFESVCHGIGGITDKTAVIFVHDGVRCLVSRDLIEACFRETCEKGSAVPIIPVQDSLRIRSAHGFEAIDRDQISIVQTPQTFRANILLKALEQRPNDQVTDESTWVERSGERVHFIAGEDFNIKITRRVDLLLAEAILATRK